MAQQRGGSISPGKALRMWIAFGLTVVVLILAGLLAARQLSTPPAPILPSAATLTQQALAALNSASTFHFAYNATGESPSNTAMVINSADGSFSKPGNIDAKIGALTGQGALASEFIVIGAQHYLLNPLTNTWALANGSGFDPATLFDPHKGIAALLKQASHLAVVDAETLLTIPTYKVTATVPASVLAQLIAESPTATTAQITLWIDQTDKTVRRIVVSGPITASDTAGTVRTLDLSQYNAAVSIKAPF